MVNFNAPLFITGTNRPATIIRPLQSTFDRLLGRTPTKWVIRADWDGDGFSSDVLFDSRQYANRDKLSNNVPFVPPAPVVDPRSAEADELLAQFYEGEGGKAAAAQARSGALRDNQMHRAILFMLNRAA